MRCRVMALDLRRAEGRWIERDLVNETEEELVGVKPPSRADVQGRSSGRRRSCRRLGRYQSAVPVEPDSRAVIRPDEVRPDVERQNGPIGDARPSPMRLVVEARPRVPRI